MNGKNYLIYRGPGPTPSISYRLYFGFVNEKVKFTVTHYAGTGDTFQSVRIIRINANNSIPEVG